MYGKHGPPKPCPPWSTGQFVTSGRPNCSPPSSKVGFTWLMSVALYNFTPWLATYATCSTIVFDSACCRFTFQFITYGVFRCWSTPNTSHGLSKLHTLPELSAFGKIVGD